MPDIPTDLKPRLQAWWGALDDGTHVIFEAIYMEAPAAVSRAISGGQWVADAPEPGLSAQLGGSHDDQHPIHAVNQVPAVLPDSEVRVTPNSPVGTPIAILWGEKNVSDVGLEGYYTDVYVEDGDGNTVASTRLTNPALAAGAAAERRFDFEGSPRPGHFTVKIWMNSEGTDHGAGVPGPQGLRSYATGSFSVGLGDDAADAQNAQILATAIITISATLTETVPSRAVEQIAEGVNWLYGQDPMDPGDAQILQNVQNWLQRSPVRDPNPGEENERFKAALATLVGSVQQANAAHPAALRFRGVLEALNTFVEREYL